MSLEDLLLGEELKTKNLSHLTRNSRLALRLALSLQSLCFGPWIQQDWCARTIHIVRNKNGNTLDTLDEIYISCTFTTSSGIPHTTQRSSWGDDNWWETSPWGDDSWWEYSSLFLSLAQLLVDINYGKNHQNSLEHDEKVWLDELRKEILKNRKIDLMKYYWEAIEGCVRYRDYYMRYELPHGRRRARSVMDRYIICPLRNHLSICEREEQVLRAADDDSLSRALAAAVGSPSTLGSIFASDRQPIGSMIRLWSKEEINYEKMQVHMPSHCFLL